MPDLWRIEYKTQESQVKCKWIEDSKELLELYEQEIPDIPTFPDQKTIELRKELIWEEFNELLDAFHEQDLVASADAVIDLLVVVIGTGLQLGLPLEELWDEVHTSNMSKMDPLTGKPNKNECGKVIKPSTYYAPRIKEVLETATSNTNNRSNI